MAMSSGWPLSPYDERVEGSLREHFPEELEMLTDAGRKSLSVFLKGRLEQGLIAAELDAKAVPRGVRQKLESLKQKNAKLAGRKDFYDTLLKEELMRSSARIDASRAGPPLPAGFFKASSRYFKTTMAWPFFPPSEALVVFEIYKSMPACAITHERIFSIARDLLGSQSDIAVKRQISRSKRNESRATQVVELVRFLKLTYSDQIAS
jgi:hypothetical protein